MPALPRLPRVDRSSTALFVSQVFSSLFSALVMLLGAGGLNSTEFVRLTLLTLLLNIVLGLARSLMYEPALVTQRTAENFRLPIPLTLGLIVAHAMSFALIGASFSIFTPSSVGILFAAGAIALGFDGARYRSMSDGKTVRLAVADGLRLTLCVPLALTIPGRSAELLLLSTGIAALLPLAILVLSPPSRSHSYRESSSSFWLQARLQVIEFMAAQLNTSIPLLIIGGISQSPVVAGVRLAQTLMGPVNMLQNAAGSVVLVDGATRGRSTSDGHLVRRGRSFGLGMVVISVVTTGVLFLLLPAYRDYLGAIGTDDILIGLALVGVATATAGYTRMVVTVLRLVGGQRIVTVGRWWVALATWVAFGIGFAFWGVDASIAAGLLVSAVAYPASIIPAANRLFRTLPSKE